MSTELEQIKQLQDTVIKLQNAVAMWTTAGLPHKTVVVLLQHYTKLSQSDIRLVLDGIDNLFDVYFTEDT